MPVSSDTNPMAEPFRIASSTHTVMGNGPSAARLCGKAAVPKDTRNGNGSRADVIDVTPVGEQKGPPVNWRGIAVILIDRVVSVIAFHEKTGRSQVDSLLFFMDKGFFSAE